MSMRLAVGSLLAVCLGTGASQAADPLTVSVQRLSLETALKVAQGAVVACRAQGIQIGVTVVDRDGTVQVKLRDTIAAPITAQISEQKAFTAANFNAPTSQLESRADTPIGRIPGLVMSAGGVPIEVGGRLLGAVGVSGAPQGDTDEACARAGIHLVLEELQMAQ